MDDDPKTMDITDVVLRVKRAFETKDLEGIRGQFVQHAVINSDGRFYDLGHLLEFLRILFDSVDQTYLDVVGVEQVEVRENSSFATFDIDVSWVDKRDWLEHSQKLSVALELVRDPKYVGKEQKPPFQIKGLTARPRPDGRGAGGDSGGSKDGFPSDTGGLDGPRPDGSGSDIFSFWY